MKTLKLDHQLVQAIRAGEKTSTWRMYDDKDLSVNDQVELIDKVEPARPETWRPFGNARINQVVQKRLADVDAGDYASYGPYESIEQRIKKFRGYYGSQVDGDTPIKLVHFVLLPENISDTTVATSTTVLTDIKLYADGGSRGNPGPSASGFVILDPQDKVVVKKSLYLGVTTNNQAEYRALKLGLEEAVAMHATNVQVYMDSLLVVNQMRGIFKIKNRDLWPIHRAIQDMIPKFSSITFTHVPRELNKLADAAVNEALDEALKHT